MQENHTQSLNALHEFFNGSTPQAREIAAVLLIQSVLNDLEGLGAYNVLASSVSTFTAAQPNVWQSMSFIIQGVLQGWNAMQQNSLNEVQAEANASVKH